MAIIDEHKGVRVRKVLVILTSVLVIFFVFRLAGAGTLNPPASPAGTLNTLTQVYASLTSTSFDSSAIVANKNGDAVQIAKCILSAMTGGTVCP